MQRESKNSAFELAQYGILRRRFLTLGGVGVNYAVAGAAGSTTVNLNLTEPDAVYGVFVTPSWNTTTYITAKTTTTFTVTYGTAAPGGGGTIDWIVFRS